MSHFLSFPADFTWGAATSSFQIEGAYNLDGKGPSIWDAFCAIPGKVANGDTGEVACDHYHKMSEDIALMKQMGLQAYRFSISWPRILPVGRGKVNKAGIAFYNNLINALLQNGIQPWVTLYHWDLPLALQFEEDGWLSHSIVDAFAKYADVCFQHFGDRVKNWITINEAWVIAMLGYGKGIFAPGRTSNREPYLAGHNLIRAHAKAVKVYREKYQALQLGQIGLSNNCDWREPRTNSPDDLAAAERALEFFISWFADPIYLGHYPESMIEMVGDRLPKFTREDVEMIHGSSDFFGLNHYTTMHAADAKGEITAGNIYDNAGLSEDQDVILSVDPAWHLTSMQWPIVPWGCRKLLEWLDERYNHPPIVITENGCAFDDVLENGKVNDHQRVGFFKAYLAEIHQAIENGVDLRGYFAWSLMDNFEWASGYDKRFGLHYVDFTTLERTPKISAKWLTEVIQKNGFMK